VSQDVRVLYVGCYRRLVAQAYAVTLDLDQAADAVREAFVRALLRPRRFRLDDPEARLRLVAVSVARRRVRHRAGLGLLLGQGRPEPIQGLVGPQHVALVVALRRLPATQREAVTLHDLAGLPPADAAEIMGIDVGTLNARRAVGRARLAELLRMGQSGPPALADPDFAGLRTAVQVAVERPPFEELRDRAAARRQRLAAGILGLAVAITVVVGRAGQIDGGGAPIRPAEAGPTGGSPATMQLIDVRFGAERGYALVGACTGAGEPIRCGYQMWVSGDRGRRWHPTELPLARPKPHAGFAARLQVDPGADRLAVMDPAARMVLLSADGGESAYQRHQLTNGPPLAAVPAGLQPDIDVCGTGCTPRVSTPLVSVLDPDTGVRSHLRSNPALAPGTPVQSLALGDDGVIWVAGAGRHSGRVQTAYSPDRGRSWQRLPVPGDPAVGWVRLVSVPGGGATYLLAGDHDGFVGRNNLTTIWWIGDPSQPDTGWAPVTLPVWPDSAQSAVGLTGGGLLISQENGATWRIDRNGQFELVSDRTVEGHTARLRDIRRGPGRMLYGTTDNDDLAVLVSEDDGASWSLRRIRR
jgi:DNA-directed RNA polymerase specialized sigma24 family protein